MPTSVPLQWKTAESEVDRADPYKQNVYIKSCVSYGYLSLERIKLAAAHDKAKATPFRVGDRGQGRVALEASDERVRIRRQGCKIRAGDASGSSGGTFLSLATNRYLSLSDNGSVTANAPGSEADRKSGSSVSWSTSAPD